MIELMSITITIIYLLIAVGLIYLAYWLPKRLGKRKLGLWIAGLLATGLLTIIVSTLVKDYFFFKSDAIECLSEHNLKLEDDFKIISNQSGGIFDSYHRLELEISHADKERIIKVILTAGNYKKDATEMFDIREVNPLYLDKDTAFTANYQNKWNYMFEYYKTNKQGIKPIWDRIAISKKKDILSYERIRD
jgi:amino acid transporter